MAGVASEGLIRKVHEPIVATALIGAIKEVFLHHLVTAVDRAPSREELAESLLDFGRMAFKKFFLREFEADQPEAVAGLLADLGMSDRHYLEYLAGEGREAYECCQQEAAADHVFGVPFFLFAGEPFWGYDRLALLEQRLAEAGLAIGHKVTAA